MKISELAGVVTGATMGPVVGFGAWLRKGRFFHPRGVLYWARVERVAAGGASGAVAGRLSGHALVRLSGALWGGRRERADILGCALRFCDNESGVPAPSDQDLLFATSPSALALPMALLTTRQHDFLANDYFAIAPFEVPGVGRVELRLAPHRVTPPSGFDRDARLAETIRQGEARFALQVRPQGGSGWSTAAMLWLDRPAAVDGSRLRFSPFRAGAGLKPTGFLHALRVVPYFVSQQVRTALRDAV